MEKMFWARSFGLAGLCWALAACGGSDSGNKDGSSNGGSGGSGTTNPSQANQLDSNQQNTQQQNTDHQSSAQSECSSSSDCEQVVCDCPDGPVNFTGCSVVNGVGTCATESTCAGSAFGACDD